MFLQVCSKRVEFLNILYILDTFIDVFNLNFQIISHLITAANSYQVFKHKLFSEWETSIFHCDFITNFDLSELDIDAVTVDYDLPFNSLEYCNRFRFKRLLLTANRVTRFDFLNTLIYEKHMFVYIDRHTSSGLPFRSLFRSIGNRFEVLFCRRRPGWIDRDF